MSNTKRVLLILTVIAVAVGTFLIIRSWFFSQSKVVGVTESISHPELYLSFTYPSGEEAYSLIERPGTSESLTHAFIIMKTDEYIALQANQNEGDAPPAISIFVFPEAEPEDVPSTTERAGRITRLQNWATDNKNLTSIHLAKNTPEVVELDGVKSLYYQADGNFAQEVYLVSYHNNIYMFVGQSQKPTDQITTVFKDLIASVSFD
ncbi:MAG: hypothetical protein AAB388_04240 [Patescibacteria group bacterium]